MPKNLITVGNLTFVQYKHHSNEVWVRQDLKGKHPSYCLCHSCVEFSASDSEANCPIAQELFELCQQNGLVTPVWECPEFAPTLGARVCLEVGRIGRPFAPALVPA